MSQASQNPSRKSALDEFFPIYGRFMHAFAGCESAIKSWVFHFTVEHIKPKIIPGYEILTLVIGELTLNSAIETLTQLLKSSLPPQPQERDIKDLEWRIGRMDKVREQMLYLLRLRNLIAHNQANPAGGRSGDFLVHGPGSKGSAGRRIAIFAPKVLEDMTQDLQLIPDYLNWVVMPSAYYGDQDVAKSGISLAEWGNAHPLPPWKFDPSMVKLAWADFSGVVNKMEPMAAPKASNKQKAKNTKKARAKDPEGQTS